MYQCFIGVRSDLAERDGLLIKIDRPVEVSKRVRKGRKAEARVVTEDFSVDEDFGFAGRAKGRERQIEQSVRSETLEQILAAGESHKERGVFVSEHRPGESHVERERGSAAETAEFSVDKKCEVEQSPACVDDFHARLCDADDDGAAHVGDFHAINFRADRGRDLQHHGEAIGIRADDKPGRVIKSYPKPGKRTLQLMLGPEGLHALRKNILQRIRQANILCLGSETVVVRVPCAGDRDTMIAPAHQGPQYRAHPRRCRPVRDAGQVQTGTQTAMR